MFSRPVGLSGTVQGASQWDPVHAVLDSLTRDPGDDTAWLALADALEEKGDPRADATRLSLWLRRWLDDSYHATWEHRLRELVAQGVRVCLPEKSVSLGKRVKLSLVRRLRAVFGWAVSKASL